MSKKIICLAYFFVFICFFSFMSLTIYNNLEFEYSQIKFKNEAEKMVKSYGMLYTVFFVKKEDEYYHFMFYKYFLIKKHIKVKESDLIIPSFITEKKNIALHFLDNSCFNLIKFKDPNVKFNFNNMYDKKYNSELHCINLVEGNKLSR